MLRKLLFGLLFVLGLLLVAVALMIYWPASTPPPDRAVGVTNLTRAEAEARAGELLAQMTIEEKTEQLHGDITSMPALARWGARAFLHPGRDLVTSGYNERLGVPALTFTDGPRGVAFAPGATAFPVAIARAASFDPALERAVGSAVGVECRRGGYNYIASPCINILRHPGWGRAQESYGEDPLLNAAFGVANVEGIQEHGVMACPKHYALNSIENNRFTVNVEVDERALHEVYLPQFKAVVDAGTASIMSSYNKAFGGFVSESRYLLEDVLREDWGFRGFVTSDWVMGLHDAAGGIRAGMDVEMPWDKYYEEVPDLVASGVLAEARIDSLVQRVVATKLEWASKAGQADADYTGRLSTEDHKALAKTVAEQSMVLLKNEGNVLPISTGEGGLLVVGALADQPNLGDEASSAVVPERTVTIIEALQRANGESVQVLHAAEPSDEQLAEAARTNATLIAVVGYAAMDEGENIALGKRDPNAPTWGTGGDRTDLRLKREDVALLKRIANAGIEQVAVVVIGGSAITMDEWIDDVPAVLMAWYPGERGGEAVASVLGGTPPGGRLPISIPREGQQLPAFDPFVDTVTYHYLHGYTWHQASEQPPRFPFGYGLSYTPSVVDTAYVLTPELSDDDSDNPGEIELVARVRNTGTKSDWAVVQAYAKWPDAAARPDGVLAAFAKTSTVPGVSSEVRLRVPLEWLRNYAGAGEWRSTPGTYTFYVGTDAEEARGRPVRFTLRDQ